MTIEQAQRIMGPEVEVEIRFWRDRPRLLARAIHCVTLEIEGNGISESGSRSAALQMLVESVYFHRSRRVFKRQKFRCADCGLLKPLQIHHIKHRSAGRDDREENLEALCQEHHEEHHSKAGQSSASSPRPQNPTS